MSGEHQNGRAAIERMADHLVKHGVPPKVAEEKARETALRMDKKGNGK
jgi:hypothetical protein